MPNTLPLMPKLFLRKSFWSVSRGNGSRSFLANAALASGESELMPNTSHSASTNLPYSSRNLHASFVHPGVPACTSHGSSQHDEFEIAQAVNACWTDLADRVLTAICSRCPPWDRRKVQQAFFFPGWIWLHHLHWIFAILYDIMHASDTRIALSQPLTGVFVIQHSQQHTYSSLGTPATCHQHSELQLPARHSIVTHSAEAMLNLICNAHDLEYLLQRLCYFH